MYVYTLTYLCKCVYKIRRLFQNRDLLGTPVVYGDGIELDSRGHFQGLRLKP